MPSSPSLNDEELARRAQNGCTSSFEELVRRFQTPLVHFLRQMAQFAEADDLAQDTFLRAYENLHRYDGTGRFSTWLFTIGRRLCLNARRRAKRSGDMPFPENIVGKGPSPSEIVANEEHNGRLWRIVAQLLSEPEYSAVWLHYVEGMTTAEIGCVVGRSRGAVKTMLFRSRQKLLGALDSLGSESAPETPREQGFVAASNNRKPKATTERRSPHPR